jgi:hypothetical protein
LLVRQDLLEPRVDVLLQVLELLFLGVRELEPLLEHLGQDLTRARRPEASRSEASGSNAPRTALAPRRLASGKGRELGFGDRPILVGIGAVEEPLKTPIGHLGLGQFAVLVLVERHHPGHDVAAAR